MEKYKEENMKSYNKHAKFFSEKFKDLLNLEERSEFRRLMELIKGKEILDIGCGDGGDASYFKEEGFNVTCIDISEKFIEMCKKKRIKFLCNGY